MRIRKIRSRRRNRLSFDIKIVQGDLAIKSDGNLEKIFNEAKLIQDILKCIFTPTGSHKLHTWYGSPLLSNTISKVNDRNLVETIIKNGVFYALSNLMTLQEMQESDGQYLAPKEALKSIDDVSIFFDEFDPRQVNVFVTVTTRLGNRTQESFTINL